MTLPPSGHAAGFASMLRHFVGPAASRRTANVVDPWINALTLPKTPLLQQNRASMRPDFAVARFSYFFRPIFVKRPSNGERQRIRAGRLRHNAPLERPCRPSRGPRPPEGPVATTLRTPSPQLRLLRVEPQKAPAPSRRTRHVENTVNLELRRGGSRGPMRHIEGYSSMK